MQDFFFLLHIFWKKILQKPQKNKTKQKKKPLKSGPKSGTPKKTFPKSYLVGALSPVNHKELHQGWFAKTLCLLLLIWTDQPWQMETTDQNT